MAWTEKDRRDLIAEMERLFTPEQISRLPEDVQRGDRFPTGDAADLWMRMQMEWTPKKAAEQVKLIAGLGPEYQDRFDEDVRTGKRQWTRDEMMEFRECSYEQSLS